MNKTQLIKAIYEKMAQEEDTYLTQSRVSALVNEVFDMIMSNMMSGEETKISGFIKFFTAESAARSYRNPQNGNEIKKPKTIRPKGKYSSVFKRKLNNKPKSTKSTRAKTSKK